MTVPAPQRSDGRTLIERARDLARHLEKDAGRPGAAAVIHDLVAEIERLSNSLVET